MGKPIARSSSLWRHVHARGIRLVWYLGFNARQYQWSDGDWSVLKQKWVTWKMNSSIRSFRCRVLESLVGLSLQGVRQIKELLARISLCCETWQSVRHSTYRIRDSNGTVDDRSHRRFPSVRCSLIRQSRATDQRRTDSNENDRCRMPIVTSKYFRFRSMWLCRHYVSWRWLNRPISSMMVRLNCSNYALYWMMHETLWATRLERVVTRLVRVAIKSSMISPKEVVRSTGLTTWVEPSSKVDGCVVDNRPKTHLAVKRRIISSQRAHSRKIPAMEHGHGSHHNVDFPCLPQTSLSIFVVVINN